MKFRLQLAHFMGNIFQRSLWCSPITKEMFSRIVGASGVVYMMTPVEPTQNINAKDFGKQNGD